MGVKMMSRVRMVIAGIAQFVAIVLVLFFTIFVGLYARGIAQAIRFLSDQALTVAAEMKRAGVGTAVLTPENLGLLVQIGNLSDPTAWSIIGATIGFLISTSVFAIIFMLAEIAHNTRLTVGFFERVNSRVNTAKT
jgi:hypothetical protein